MPQLYMSYLGGNAGKSNIEAHDVQAKEKAKGGLLSGYS